MGELRASVGTDPGPGRLPVVAVVGRPNVGKSTLVNRLVGRRVAVVEERPGVTRDRLAVEAQWAGRRFVVLDTGGWLPRGDALEAKVSAQAERGLAEADLVLFVVDVTVAPTEEDLAMARLVRRAGRPTLLVANKADNDRRELDAWAYLALGLGDPFPVSALHGRQTGALLDQVLAQLPVAPEVAVAGEPGAAAVTDEEEAADPALAVAIVGRPNVGKSTLFNRLVGEERAVVHDLPGTTRDALDTLLSTPEGPIRFIDTAGIRRRSRHEEGSEFYAMVRSLQAIDRADVVLLVVDATEGVSHQDQRLAERIGAAGSPVVVVLNKWELLPTERRPEVLDGVADRLAFLGEVPVVKVSAKTGLGVHKILPALRQAGDAYRQRVPTGELNRAVRAAQEAHPAPGGARIRYAVQATAEPPTFTLFASRRLPPTYLRYLERQLRQRFALGPTPVVFRVRVGGR
ncbi:ribosome biogenesis GTPase Der [Aciditerrimonas ferrireducens]|uniref:GTPase Der n=1 Tax=Aciditerrimonas ferrireducens TaxID=667306 RepID=A0ABV6BZF1_9ACTN